MFDPMTASVVLLCVRRSFVVRHSVARSLLLSKVIRSFHVRLSGDQGFADMQSILRRSPFHVYEMLKMGAQCTCATYVHCRIVGVLRTPTPRLRLLRTVPPVVV